MHDTHHDAHKLSHLIEHWIEHNESHLESYREWAGRAGEFGNPALESALKEVLTATEALGEALRKADRACGHAH